MSCDFSSGAELLNSKSDMLDFKSVVGQSRLMKILKNTMRYLKNYMTNTRKKQK